MQQCLFCDFSVGGGVEKGIELSPVAHLYLDDPGAVCILVDEFRLVLEGFVACNNLSGYRSDELAGGLHAFECTEVVSGIEFIEMDSDKVLVPGALEQEAASIIERCARLIQQGVTCCVSTKRTVLTLPDDTPEAALVRSVAISDALQSCVGKLPVTPAFVVAKGGITSSDVGVKALRVQCARVLGQIRPGIPVWQTGPESLFPGTPYVIFPGNVGEMSTLREAIEILLG